MSVFFLTTVFDTHRFAIWCQIEGVKNLKENQYGLLDGYVFFHLFILINLFFFTVIGGNIRYGIHFWVLLHGVES